MHSLRSERSHRVFYIYNLNCAKGVRSARSDQYSSTLFSGCQGWSNGGVFSFTLHVSCLCVLVAGSEQNSDSYPTRASCRRRRSQLREGHIFFCSLFAYSNQLNPFDWVNTFAIGFQMSRVELKKKISQAACVRIIWMYMQSAFLKDQIQVIWKKYVHWFYVKGLLNAKSVLGSCESNPRVFCCCKFINFFLQSIVACNVKQFGYRDLVKFFLLIKRDWWQ